MYHLGVAWHGEQIDWGEMDATLVVPWKCPTWQQGVPLLSMVLGLVWVALYGRHAVAGKRNNRQVPLQCTDVVLVGTVQGVKHVLYVFVLKMNE